MSETQWPERPACRACVTAAALLLCCVGGTHAETAGLVAHWDMAAISDGKIRDVSGNGHHVTVHSRVPPAAPVLVPGLIGNALALDASKQLWLATSKPEAFNVAAPMTLMAWVRPSDSMRRRSGEILCKAFDLNERGRAPWHGWRLRCGWGMFFFRYTKPNGQLAGWRSPPGTVPVGSWTHVAVTLDGKTVRFFVSGVQKLVASDKGNITASTHPLTIGNYLGTKVPYAFDGALDEMKIFGRALSKNEIWQEACPPSSY